MKVPLHCRAAAGHAEELIRKLKIADLPVDPIDIARQHGIEVKAKPSSSPGVSGFLMKVGDTFGIMYATHIRNDGFIRFTIAHELGHYFLPGHPDKLFPAGDGLHESRSGFVSRDQHEEEADHFAAALLMPTTLFSKAMHDAGEGFAAIDRLASLCKTSITATAIRFAMYSPDPVAVVISSGRSIEYCFMSEVLRDLRGITWIRKGDALPSQSETYRFNSDASNVAAGSKAEAWTNLDLWFDGAPNLDMKEDVVGLGSYDKTLTVLYTDEALDDEDDGDFDD
ncbi:MAG: hypothetical protein BroJett005_30420 [Ignavibacteriota bacterium]|nr:MAG: hypothetical protein BroJett005_30420 [Ignavibacteriota bacterium]